ncbi:MAG TPA: DotA/TraY family protein, partial [Alphaproteobacteria bacterium]|nr:DotA/TraY family protein [Alphaproteobacteria bacterium]
MIFGASRSDIAKYVLLPQIWPRIRALFGKGFEMVPYMLALVYQCVRLLPPSHPYADPRNIGRFTLRNVVAEAANHLVFRLGNIDQIVLFVAVLAGIVLAIVQFFLLGLALFVQPALAAMPTNFSEFFLSADPQDLSYMMLDLVFGVEGVFNSCVTSSSCVDMDGRPLLPDPAVGGLSVFHQSAWPYPIHAGLHELFRMYNLALLIVGMIIALYFMFTVVAETAQTGTAFGKRFNKVWAPLRIVVAFGLLVPIGHLNTAQYIVLYTAKFGTGFASKGWYLFNERLGYNYKAGMGDLVGKPQIPEVGALLQFMFTARTCYETDFIMNKRTSKIKPYAVKGGGILSPGDKRELSTYEDLSDFMAGQNVATIRFGVFDDKAYGTYKGFVAPLCGELNFILTDSRPHPEQEVGTKGLQKAYFDLMMHLWNTEWGAPGSGSGKPWNHACRQIGKCEQANKKDLPELTEAEITSATNNASTLVNTAVEAAVTAQNTSGRFDLAGGANEQIIKKGWPAAAIWYNRIAEMNGTLSTAAFRVPMPHKYPQAMEFVRAKKMQYDEDVPAIDKYKPQLSDGTPVKHPDIDYAEAIKAMHSAYVKWQANGVAGSGHTDVTG